MNAFISYSHKDELSLNHLHTHLTQLRRDQLITTWTDREIHAGGLLNDQISSALRSSKIFIALISPDYIASKYCYDIELKAALDMAENGQILIVPVILEPCDWLNTPFNKFMALPKDGKPTNTWENTNTAFLDVAQNLRRLVNGGINLSSQQEITNEIFPISSARNYRVQKDFDSIEKMKFVEKTFKEISDYITRYIQEIIQIDNIKAMVLRKNDELFECLLVNRNKIDTEATLRIIVNSKDIPTNFFNNRTAGELQYRISNKNNNGVNSVYSLQNDEYDLYWTQSQFGFYSSQKETKFESKEIADNIWDELLKNVGIF